MGVDRASVTTSPRGSGPGRRGPRNGLVGLLIANLVSVAGGSVSLVALPWFVLATTGSTVATGVAVVAETLPVVAVALVAGTVVHRVGAVATRIGSDVISAVTVLAIPALHATVGLAYWQLLVLVAVNGAARAPAPAASLVLLNTLSASGGTPPDRARANYVASVRLAAAVSAPLGGLLIAVWGAPTALVVDAASFAVSALLLTATLHVRRPSDPTSRWNTDPPLRAWDGLRALTSDQVLTLLSAVVVMLAVLEGAWVGVLAPAYGQRVLHSSTALGLLLGLFGVGALLGNLTYPWVAERADHHLLVWTCLGASTALRYGVLGASTVQPLLAGAVLLAGLASGLLSPLWLRLLSDRTKPPLHGHVFGITFGLEQGGYAIGALAGGLVLARVSISAALIGAAGISVALALLAATAPPLRALHHGRTTTLPSPSR